MTVVHVTHRRGETAGADRVVQLIEGRVVADEANGTRPLAGPKGRVGPGGPGGPSRRRPLVRPNGRVGPGRPGVASGRNGDGPTVGDGYWPPPIRPDRMAPGLVHAPLGPQGAPLVRLRGVGHVYANRTPWSQSALLDVDLEIGAGEGVLVVGGNGSGKSTLAWILAGLVRSTFGYCELDGRAVHTQVGTVGVAFQHARLQVQRPTVGRDVQAAGDVDRSGAEAALGRVGLDPAELWERSVDELSGGQLRRVAIAGLLTRTPRVLVLDEPLAGLDEASRDGLIAVLAGLRAAHGLTLIVISHDVEGAGDVCDRVVRLEAGRVVADEALATVTMEPR